MQVTHVVVHTPEQARGIISEARAIADELSADAVHWEATFAEACKLLGQRFTLAVDQHPMPVHLPAMAIPGGRH